MARNVVITGCNRGIGLELAKIYAAQGDKVIALVRTKSEEIQSIAHQIYSDVDVTREEELKKVVAGIETVDILINNAGIFENENFPFEAKDWQQIRRQFEVNTLAPLLVANLFLPKMKRASLMGFVSSRMGSIENNTTGGYYGYRMSKAALNMAVKTLACDLKEREITTVALHPGYVKTRMTGFHGEITPDIAAQGIFKVLSEVTFEHSGSFWHSNGQELPW